MPKLEGGPKLVLLTDDKVKVPFDAFEDVAGGLTGWIQSLDQDEKNIMSLELSVPKPVQEPEETPNEGKAKPKVVEEFKS